MLYELNRVEYDNVTHNLRRNRLVKRSCHFRWYGAVNEHLAVSGHFLKSDISISHHSNDRALLNQRK
jgi:hypothetical protein